MTDTPTATIHHLPPMRRKLPTEAQRSQMEPFAEVMRRMPDGHFSLAFEMMIDEVRRRHADLVRRLSPSGDPFCG